MQRLSYSGWRMIAPVYKWLLRVGKVAGAISFLFAVPYGVFEYWRHGQEQRVEKTLKFYKQFNSAPFITYRENVFKSLAKYKDKINSAAAKDEIALGAVMSELVNQGDLEKDIYLIMDFFDGLLICITEEICDGKTALSLFSPRAKELRINLYQYIQAQRLSTTTKNFGLGMEAIATTKFEQFSSQGQK